MAKKDSILAHCLARAVIYQEGGEDAAGDGFGANAERLSKWAALRVATKATPLAARLAEFIVCWAIAMRAEGCDEYSITQYQRFGCKWEAQARECLRFQRSFALFGPFLH